MMKICLMDMNDEKGSNTRNFRELFEFLRGEKCFFLEWKEFTSNYSTARKWPTCSLITKSKSSSTLTIFWSCQNVLRSARGQPKAHPTLRLRVYDVTKFYDVINSQKFKLQQTKTHRSRSAAVKNQTSCDRHFVGRTSGGLFGGLGGESTKDVGLEPGSARSARRVSRGGISCAGCLFVKEESKKWFKVCGESPGKCGEKESMWLRWWLQIWFEKGQLPFGEHYLQGNS